MDLVAEMIFTVLDFQALYASAWALSL